MQKILLCFAALELLATAADPGLCFELRLKDAPVQLYFSPRGGCQEAILTAIGQARQSIYVQAFSFTSKPIAQALIAAKQRRVRVAVIVDKSQLNEARTQADELSQAGIEVLVDAQHNIAHNKVMIFDEQSVLSGSFNFTRSAEEHNAENVLLIKDKTLARLYLENWREHARHSQEM